MDMPESNGYYLRTYRFGDEADLTSLFNKVYKYFIGFVPRTLAYWKYCIQSHPNLEKEGIAVVANADNIVGYTAIEKSGNMLEFCYDPSYEGKIIVTMLLSWCVEYVNRHGGNFIILNAPVQDDVVRQVCQKSGFSEQPFTYAVGTLFLRVTNFPQFLRKILNQKKKVRKGINETILIKLRNVPFWCDDYVILRIREERIAVLKRKTEKPTIEIYTDVFTISSCIFGSPRRIYGEILKRRLKVRPFWKIPGAVKIFSCLQIKNPWYVPRADLSMKLE